MGDELSKGLRAQRHANACLEEKYTAPCSEPGQCAQAGEGHDMDAVRSDSLTPGLRASAVPYP